jgi:predicted N-acyltransferase
MTGEKVYVYDTAKDVDQNQWNNLVSQSETGSVFQRAEWLQAVEEGLSANPIHLVVQRDGNIIGVFPNFEVDIELPDRLSKLSWFSPTKAVSTSPGFGGPITSSSDDSILNTLFEAIETATADRTMYHQLNFLDQTYLGYATFLRNRGYIPSVKSCRFVIDLNQDFDKITSQMSSGRRRNLRKAEEQDYRIVDEDISPSIIDEFYRKYSRVMRRVEADPLPLQFVEKLAEHLTDRVKIFTLEVDGTEAGRHLNILDEEQDTVHYFFSSVESADFEYYPSELLHTHAIKWGIDNGFKQYDFGETSANNSDGLFNYKKQYGGEPIPTLSWETGLSTTRWHLFRLGRWLYRNRGTRKSEE